MTDTGGRRRLATLVVEVLEVGTAKREWDVVDELFDGFGLDFAAIAAAFPAESRPGAPALRATAAGRLADAAPSAVALMNSIIRSGSRFLAMVEEIYARLANEAATTAGTSETFRLQRAGLDEAGLTISPAFIEQVRRLRRSLTAVPVGRIDDDALDNFIRWDNGEMYGRWPFGQDDGLRLADAVLHLAWIPDNPAVTAARAAGERLVAAAERLVRAHIDHLDRHAETDPGSAATMLFEGERSPRWSRRFEDELRRFRAEGVLVATAVRGTVANIDGTSDVGLDRDLAPVVQPSADYWWGTGVSDLAGFVAQWRLGLWAQRTQAELQDRFVADPSGLTVWLDAVTTASGEAAAWLESDVLVPAGTVDAVRSVEVLEEFLNLPLWRERDLLYEVWTLCATLAAAEQAGWAARLLALVESGGVWTLRRGSATDPVARLEDVEDPAMSLDVWREPRRIWDGAVFTPDLAVTTPGLLARDLLVVEAKDRWKMPSGTTAGKHPREKETALWAARRYARALTPVATWVCNYCGFGETVDPETNYGDPWTRVHLAGEFQPGAVPGAFTASVRTALAPNPARRSTALTLVVDVTSSMRDHLETVWSAVTERGAWADFREYRAVLYRDHGSSEPFVVRNLGPFPDLASLLAAVTAEQPGGGGDFPEALEDAMRQGPIIAATVGPHAVVVLTDAPPHPPADCPDGIDFTAEVEALLATGCDLHVAIDWLDADDVTWSPFAGRDGFSAASLETLLTLTATPAPATPAVPVRSAR